MEGENPVLLYKPQGMENKIKVFPHLLSSDFIPCMQTDSNNSLCSVAQTRLIVCVDNTHGTTQYQFNLITVMVIDDFAEGNQVAFMICNHALVAFFPAIKLQLPPGVTSSETHLMTDDACQ